jgi:translation initiation factor 1
MRMTRIAARYGSNKLAMRFASAPGRAKCSGMGLVYSTEAGRMCPQCRRPAAACVCKDVSARAAGDGFVRVSRETKGRGGKSVTLVRGLPLDDAALSSLGKRLRSACGAGGTHKAGVIEVQGDQADRLVALLQAEGWRVKRAGG